LLCVAAAAPALDGGRSWMNEGGGRCTIAISIVPCVLWGINNKNGRRSLVHDSPPRNNMCPPTHCLRHVFQKDIARASSLLSPLVRTVSAPKEHWATSGWYLNSNIQMVKIRNFSI
jgi:hypothetical protein